MVNAVVISGLLSFLYTDCISLLNNKFSYSSGSVAVVYHSWLITRIVPQLYKDMQE